MPPIDPRLLEKLETKLGVTRGEVYKRIGRTAGELFVQRDLAALALAAELGININRGGLATDSQLAALREAKGSGRTTARVTPASEPTRSEARARVGIARKSSKRPARKSNKVMVVHGRNLIARDEVFTFLRSIGLNPIEWGSAMKSTATATPYVGQVISKMFENAAAVLVLLTPDDEARLKTKFRKSSDPSFERQLTGQARPNVLFESGRAFGSHPDATVLVQVGVVRKFSDTEGLHIVHLADSPLCRKDISQRLETAGCEVDLSGNDWLSAGDFAKVMKSVK